MKVLKRGTKKEKVYRATCRGCGSKLEFTQADGRVINDRNEMILLVSCPECNQQISVYV